MYVCMCVCVSGWRRRQVAGVGGVLYASLNVYLCVGICVCQSDGERDKGLVNHYSDRQPIVRTVRAVVSVCTCACLCACYRNRQRFITG